MGEREIIERSKNGPVTVDSLVADLSSLGLKPGDIVLVHSSLSALGWVCGGPVSVILALEEVIRPYGTLIMPTHSGNLSDPAAWEHPPVPREWWTTIRDTMPPYDPELTPTRGMGAIPECFRNQRNVIRSTHPHLSFAAWGEHAMQIIDNHSLSFSLGENSPLARLYELDGKLLLLGTAHSCNTSLHLSEIRASWPRKRYRFFHAPLMVNGHRRWKRFRDIDYDSDDFARIGQDFEKRHKQDVAIGQVGYGKARLFSQRLCVDYGVAWIARKRR